MPNNNIYISIGGAKFTGWSTVIIRQSIETLCSSFELIVTDSNKQNSNADWLLRTQEECIIYIDDTKLITGYIENVDANISAEQHSIMVSGRDKTADIVDCNYSESAASFSKKTILTLVKTLINPFGLSAKLDVGISDSKSFQFTVNKNETIHKNLSKKAQDFAMLLITDANGNIVITNAGNSKLTDTLALGTNVLSAKANFQYMERFSTYILQAQTLNKQVKGTWATKVNIKATATDDAITRHRPKIIKTSSPLSRNMAQDRVNWEALIRSAKSQTLTVTVQGFRDSNNNVWEVNKLIDVYIPALYVNPSLEMLISSVEFSINDDGSFTKLTLKRKDAYRAEPVNKVKSASPKLGWDNLKRSVREGITNVTGF